MTSGKSGVEARQHALTSNVVEAPLPLGTGHLDLDHLSLEEEFEIGHCAL